MIFLKQINVCLSSIYNDTSKSNFEKLEKIIKLLSWSKHSLSNSEKNRMYPLYILSVLIDLTFSPRMLLNSQILENAPR